MEGELEGELSGLVFLRHAITEQHVTGEYGLTVDTLFGDDGVAAADGKRARPVYVFMDPVL